MMTFQNLSKSNLQKQIIKKFVCTVNDEQTLYTERRMWAQGISPQHKSRVFYAYVFTKFVFSHSVNHISFYHFFIQKFYT